MRETEIQRKARLAKEADESARRRRNSESSQPYTPTPFVPVVDDFSTGSSTGSGSDYSGGGGTFDGGGASGDY